MSDITVKVRPLSDKIGEEIPLPRYTTPGSAAADLHACIDGPMTIAPGERALLPTGIAVELPDSSHAAFVFNRSGMGIKHGVTLSNGVGVIDSDYRGEIHVGLTNLSTAPYTVYPGDRIAQLCVMPVCRALFEVCGELSDTDRGEGGFGSTGK